MGSGDKPETSFQMPIALEFRRFLPVKKGVVGVQGRKKENGGGCSPEGEHTGEHWALC